MGQVGVNLGPRARQYDPQEGSKRGQLEVPGAFLEHLFASCVEKVNSWNPFFPSGKPLILKVQGCLEERLGPFWVHLGEKLYHLGLG